MLQNVFIQQMLKNPTDRDDSKWGIYLCAQKTDILSSGGNRNEVHTQEQMDNDGVVMNGRGYRPEQLALAKKSTSLGNSENLKTKVGKVMEINGGGIPSRRPHIPNCSETGTDV